MELAKALDFELEKHAIFICNFDLGIVVVKSGHLLVGLMEIAAESFESPVLLVTNTHMGKLVTVTRCFELGPGFLNFGG